MDHQSLSQYIRQLAAEKNAIILAHNYQPPEIQDIADLCGDSLELSLKASKTDADIIVFCGVHFMAETASILSPHKTVLLPIKDAGCPMADMVTPEALQQKIHDLGGIPVVTYVNSSAAVKALSTVCCTSANVTAITQAMTENAVLMVPDRNLAQYAASKTNKTIHLWEGYCPIHNRLTPEAIHYARQDHPEAVVILHPECRPETLKTADIITSTSGMIRFAQSSNRKTFIIGTEVGILYPLQQACPDKSFFPASTDMFCPDMKKITLDDVRLSLEHLTGEVKVAEAIRKPAYQAVQRMIDMS